MSAERTPLTIRGEVAIDLGPHKGYVLRPTFEALCQIEAELHEGAMPLAMRFLARQVGMRDVAVIVHRCGSAVRDNPKLSYAEVGAFVKQGGFVKFLPLVAMMLDQALTDPEADPPQAATVETATAPAGSPGAAS